MGVTPDRLTRHRAAVEWNNSVGRCTKAHVSGGLLILFAGSFDMFDRAMAQI